MYLCNILYNFYQMGFFQWHLVYFTEPLLVALLHSYVALLRSYVALLRSIAM